jgi:hypothetical protein
MKKTSTEDTAAPQDQEFAQNPLLSSLVATRYQRCGQEFSNGSPAGIQQIQGSKDKPPQPGAESPRQL